MPYARMMMYILIGTCVNHMALADDAGLIESKLRECGGCHGADGISIAPTIPNLAGQKEEYLKQTLAAYRDGTRQGGGAAMMTPMAAGLSDDEIAAMAKHYSAM